ncbi:hypothetical protein ABEB36_002037 [Hypothenemus hampei]|uniref:Transposable element P transposase-like GTP-binding insertion domain-containing protein n=1 Tax=Hypothenemus hampei TaxID=57062 RepID=A0ABD1F507_HYPHA
MKVSVAAQVFSTSVAAMLRRMALTSDDSNNIPKEAASTAEFLLFMDKVFDSVNGSSLKRKRGKTLRCAVTERSIHKEFWREAINVFQSMRFIDSTNKGRTRNFVLASLKNWVHTIRGFSYLWEQLNNDSVSFLCTYTSHGVRNINPNCSSFVNSFKSLIVNNYISNHASSFNCENDYLEDLDNLKQMLTSDIPLTITHVPYLELFIPEFEPQYSSLLKKGKLTYEAGFIAKKTIEKFKNCNESKNDLIGGDRNKPEYFVIVGKAFTGNSLLAPTTNFNLYFQKCIHILTYILPQVCYYFNIAKVFETVLNHACKDQIFTCKNHDIANFLLNFIICSHILVWTKNVNRILKGKQPIGSTSDPIKIYAKRKFLAHQRFLKKFTK